MTSNPPVTPAPEPLSRRRHLLLRARTSQAIRAGAIVGLATIIMNGAAYLYNVACIRYLGSSVYGDVAAILALNAIVALPLGSLQLVLAREISQARVLGQTGGLLKRWTVRASIGGAVVVLIGLALSEQIQDVLNIQSQTTLVIGLGAIFFAVVAAVLFGVLQGEMRFRGLGLTYGVGGLARPILVVPALLLGFGAAGALAVNTIAGLVAVLVAAWALRDLWGVDEKGTAPLHDRRQTTVMLIGSLAFASLTNADVLLAKYFLDDADAGVYAAAALIGKAVLFLPAAVVTVLLPKAASRYAIGVTSQGILYASAAVTLTLCLAATAVLALLPESAVVWAFGGDFRDSTALLGWFGLAMTAAALLNVYLSVYFAERDAWFPLLVMAAAVAQIGGVIAFHDDALAIVLVTLGCCTAVLAVHELFFSHSVVHAWIARRRAQAPS